MRALRLLPLLSLLGVPAACVRHAPSARAVAPAAPLALGVDVHAHVLMGQSLPFYAGEPGRGPLAQSPVHTMVNQLDAPTLRRAGVRLLVATLWPPPATRPGRTALGEALAQLRALAAFEERQPHFRRALSSGEARALLARGQLAMLPHLEGAEGVGRVEDVDLLYAAGARGLGLVHFTDNALADAEEGQFGPVAALVLDGPRGGLTPLGREAVRRMMALGILIDLAHASPRTIEDVLALTEPAGVPVLYSHAGSGFMTERTLPDALAVRIARGGGLIGIGVYRSDFLTPTPEAERWEGHQRHTCDDVVLHWLHYRQVVGEEALVLGSDLSAPINRPLPGGLCPEGLRHAGDLPTLFAALQARGVSRASLDSMGERFLRLWQQVEAKASPRAQQEARARPVPHPDVLDVPL